jgi:hypothetical protein
LSREIRGELKDKVSLNIREESITGRENWQIKSNVVSISLKLKIITNQ